jgi:acetate---CoA ligase (ADP-forming)
VTTAAVAGNRSSSGPVGEPDLQFLFRPRSVVFIGASADPGRLTGRPLRYLRRHGFAGDVYLVHPRETEIDGVPAVRSVPELPVAPDVAVVMLPAGKVPQVARDCAQLGVKHLVILSSGFEETGSGQAIAAELKATAAAAGMGVVGPNSEGLWFVPGRSILTFGSAANRDVLRSGPVAVLSQSGSIGASIMRRLNDSGVGADVFVSVGNETVLEAADYLGWVVDNADVRVVVCFLEGLRHGDRFARAASRARRRGIAVVVLHSGTSDAGRAASASHTGKISSAADVYRSVFAQSGVIQVDSVEALAGAAAALAGPRLLASTGAGDRAGRNGLTVIGLSGGSRSIIADATCRLGVPLAELTDETTSELATFIPDFGVVTNPVDPTGQVLSDSRLFPRTIEVLAADPHTEALMVQYANGGLGLVEQHLQALSRVTRERGIPVTVSCLLDQLPAHDPMLASLVTHGITYASDPVQAVERLSLLYRVRAEADAPELGPAVLPGDPARLSGWTDGTGFTARHGIEPPAELAVRAGLTQAQVADALSAAGLPLPVVVKPSPDDIGHKSEAGLVHLGVDSAEAVRAAVDSVLAALPDASQVLVQEQVDTTRELLVVLRQDDDFGPVLGVGPGGFFVELLSEVSWVLLPADARQIEAALLRTKLAIILAGYRGIPAVDPALVAEGLRRLGDGYAALLSPPRLLELNPVTVGPDGRLRVLDVMIEGAS